MRKIRFAAAAKVQICLYASVLSTMVAAQGVGSVVESQALILGQSRTQSVQSAPVANSEALSLLLDQNHQLQTEIQALRALLEQQGFEIRKLQRDSLSRYSNVDERLSGLEAAAVTSSPGNDAVDSTLASSPAAVTPADSDAAAIVATIERPVTAIPATDRRTQSSVRNTVRSSGRGTLQPAVLTEQQLYQMAYDSVINSNFKRSIAEFDQYLSVYPAGRFVTNAHYWKGQAFLYLNRYAEARDAYEIIMDRYQDSAKLPDAMYGLGLAYQGLGNIAQARQLLNDIKTRFPNTGVANLADTRLLSLD
ncbi:MAG: tol-pal system protein YbgF [Proteobacteria bacterium]|nr:tol-pal system protein YbgF [Pseudomonadota bacterium]